MGETSLQSYNGRLAVDALRGPLRAQQIIAQLEAHSHPERVSLGQDLTGTEKRVRFLRGCLLHAVAASAGSRVTDRAQVIGAFCAEIGLEYAEALAEMRVVGACGEYADETYPSLTWGHYRVAAERTALPGDTPESRQMRAQEYLRLAEDGDSVETATGTVVRPLSVRDLEDRINQDLGKGKYAPVGPTDDEAPPLPTEPPEARVVAEAAPEHTDATADRVARYNRAYSLFESSLGDVLTPDELHTAASLCLAFHEQESR